MKIILLIMVFVCCCNCLVYAQQVDSLVEKITSIPNKFCDKIRKKTNHIDESVTKQTARYLKRMARMEMKLKEKLAMSDSLTAKNLFMGTSDKYKYLLDKLMRMDSLPKSLSGAYYPYIDSLKNSLSFLKVNSSKNPGAALNNKLQESVRGFNQLQSRLEVAEEIQQFMSQRKQQLRQVFAKYTNLTSAKKYVDDYSKQVYYYEKQISEYKNILNDPDMLQRKVLGILNKLPVYQQFIKQHSMLAGLFNLGGAGGDINSPMQSATGMPTRDQVMAAMQNQAGLPGPNVTSLIQKNVQSAEGQLDQLRNKLNAYGNNGGDIDMPDFKPNNQKTKSFLQRLEYGSNLQTAHGSYYFPTTTDLALSVGYKLNDKSSVGIGASYKVGWGSDIKHINISSQGAGLRSFLDMQLKKTFFASGGFEYNYQQPFSSLSAVSSLSSWQQSGLIGISKIVSLKTKMLKKSKIQLLWDFLSYQQVPRTQPLKFRIGYSF